MLKRARERDVRFNKLKCNFSVKKAKYLGHVLSENGIHGDESKINANRTDKEIK